MALDIEAIRRIATPAGLPFQVQKIGHVVLRARDLDRSVRFYTEVLGFRISDVYPEDMMPGGMVFMRYGTDHHGVALVGGATDADRKRELDHLAFEVATLDEVFRAREHLERHDVRIVFEGRRRAGVQIAVEFLDPDDHHLEIYWGLDRVGSDGRVRPKEEWMGIRTLEAAVLNPVPGQDTTLHDPTFVALVEAARHRDG